MTTQANTTSKELRKKVQYQFETMQVLPSQEAISQGAMTWEQIVEYKTDKAMALIEAYVAQRVNETLADCYADGLINARTRAAFKSVNNKMGGEE